MLNLGEIENWLKEHSINNYMISEDLYEKYKEWCHSMNYLIHPYFLSSENHLFCKNLELFKGYYRFKP